jgi:hypothetical protein
VVAPTALALIATMFPRRQAAEQGDGRVRDDVRRGLRGRPDRGRVLVTYFSWRWVLFVNVPIGTVTALAAPRVLPASARQAGRFDLPGAITGTPAVRAAVIGPAGSGSARAPRRTAARRMPPAASELGQLRAWHRDPHPARAEIDDEGGVILDTDDPAEAVLIVCYLVLLRELLGRRSGRRGAEGTCGQEAPGGGAGMFHHDQYAPRRSPVPAAFPGGVRGRLGHDVITAAR